MDGFFRRMLSARQPHNTASLLCIGREGVGTTKRRRELVVVKLEYRELGEIARRHTQTGTVLHGEAPSPTPSFPHPPSLSLRYQFSHSSVRTQVARAVLSRAFSPTETAYNRMDGCHCELRCSMATSYLLLHHPPSGVRRDVLERTLGEPKHFRTPRPR